MEITYFRDGEIISRNDALSLVSDVVPTLEHVQPPPQADILNLERTLKESPTGVLRYAYYNDEVKKRVEKLGYRPLPISKKYNLMPHQIDIIKYMRRIENERNSYGLRGGILQLEMGLGKTLIAISHSLISPSGGFPTLVVVQKSLLRMWRDDGFFQFFDNRVKVLYFHNEMATLENVTRSDVLKYDFVITTFDVLESANKQIAYYKRCLVMTGRRVFGVRNVERREADRPSRTGLHILYCTPWDRVICDESQAICNFKSKRFKNCKALYGKYVWCLTGTPVKNRPVDLWCQLSFCGFSAITSPRGKLGFAPKHVNIYRLCNNIKILGFNDVGVKLPPKSITIIPIVMEKKEKRLYSHKLLDIKSKVNHEDYISTLSKISGLRLFCNAPFLDSKISRETNHKSYNTETLITFKNNSWPEDPFDTGGIRYPKIRAIVETLKGVKQKSLIFSSFSKCLMLIKIALDREGISSRLYTGTETSIARNKTLGEFRNDDVKVLLLTYQIGSVGLNITEAKVVFCVEPGWNHVVHDQAVGRSWRLGQTDRVRVFSFVTTNSIEVPIHKLCEDKRNMAKALVTGNTKNAVVNSTLSIVELKRLLRDGE